MFESIQREEWYDMVDTVMQREEGLRGIRKQRDRPFTAYVANEKEEYLGEITFDARHFAKEHRVDVSQISFCVANITNSKLEPVGARERSITSFLGYVLRRAIIC